MSSSSTLYFQLHQTAEAFARSYNYDECVQDICTLSITLSPSCEHYIGPSSVHESLEMAGSPLSNKDVEERTASALTFLKAYSFETRDITVDEVQRKAVIHAVHKPSMKAEYGEDSCELDTMVTLWMNEDGTAIDKVHQFVDSSSTTKFFEEQQWVSRRSEERDPG